MIVDTDSDTIIAQCTPTGSGALALIRLSGNHAISIAHAIGKLASGYALNTVPSHTVHFGWIVDEHDMSIDQVMFIVMHGPKTFTGQDTVEITAHNNQFIVAAILHQAINHGARLAREGEFTKRAVLHGKIDLVQAEAVHELIHANTHYALKKSLAQLEGSLSHWATNIEKDLVRALALSEASFEFLDEEASFAPAICQIVEQTRINLMMIKKNFNHQQQIRQGMRITLIGSVNAGKSSLFNAMLNKERAIVTTIAGTTRDTIEAGLYKNDCYWTLIDTAGLRQTNDIIEQKGIERSHQEAAQADIIIVVVDQSRPMTLQERSAYQDIIMRYNHKIIVVYTKADMPPCPYEPLSELPILSVSTINRFNIDLLEQEIAKKIAILCAEADAPFLLNQRQFNLLLGLEKSLDSVMELVSQDTVAYEILSLHLKDAIGHISELTGKSIAQEAMNVVFREFCVGK